MGSGEKTSLPTSHFPLPPLHFPLPTPKRMSVQNYKDLIVWQKSMCLVEEVYRLSSNSPKEESFSLTNQIRRAAVSIPSNIAEGQERKGTAEFINFLSISMGSRAEVETQLMIAQRLGYISLTDLDKTLELSNEIKRMTHSLVSKLKHREKPK